MVKKDVSRQTSDVSRGSKLHIFAFCRRETILRVMANREERGRSDPLRYASIQN